MTEAIVRTHAIGVEAVGIGKHFGSFHALSDVSLKVTPGSVHGLLGENGAGKSTLVKCLLGYYRADEAASSSTTAKPPSSVPPMPMRSASAWCTSISPWSRR